MFEQHRVQNFTNVLSKQTSLLHLPNIVVYLPEKTGSERLAQTLSAHHNLFGSSTDSPE
jgi:hypothetical protein